MTTNMPFTEVDFETYKANLKRYLKSQDRFADYDFEGSNISVLIDILALNAFQQGIYNNMAFAEMFLDSVQLRNNAMSHAKELGYVPMSKTSSMAKLDLTINTSGLTPSSVTVPRGTKFRASCGNVMYTFSTDAAYTAVRSSNGYRLSDISVYEGEYQTEIYTVDETKDQQFVITNTSVDINSIRVYVRENVLPTARRIEYTFTDTIFGVEADDTRFYVHAHFDNMYKIEFGRDIFGKQPVNGNVIEIVYRTTKGHLANGATNFAAIDTTSGGFPITVTSNTRSVNGSDREPIEDIKFYAPKSVQVQERAVTRQDYEVLLKSRFPNIQAVTAFGGEELDPPRYGKVVISVDVLGVEGASDTELRVFSNYLRTKTPLTIEPIFTPAKFVSTAVELFVYYDPRKTKKSTAEIRQLVLDSIKSYSDTNLNKFNIWLRHSSLSKIIDSTDISIVSNDLTLDPIIEFTPVTNAFNSPSFSFHSELRVSQPLNEFYLNTRGYSPAIVSSNFSLNGTYVYLMDNGLGAIHAITTNANNRRVFRRNVGTIDYATGAVNISNILVSSFDGTGIKFRGFTQKNDIPPIRDRILLIREKDIDITVSPIRE